MAACSLSSLSSRSKNVRDKYEKLKSSDKTRGKTKYWPESAREIGLVNAHESISKKGGIHFVTL